MEDNNSEYLRIIEKKISDLRERDKSYSIFGSEDHKYKFNPKIPAQVISAFEKNHNITLPKSYKDFITKFGNGGCGPKYGLMNLELGVFDTPHYPEESEIIRLSNIFKFKTFWNMEDFPTEDLCAWEAEYEDSKWTDGMLRICHEGCGTFSNIVITGEEKGNIWIDDRANDGGIYPVNHYAGKKTTTFFEWYINWLDDSIIKTTYNKK